MDQAIDDEFAGTASARLTLSARLAELDLYPPLALSGCGTDWADHLLPAAELHRRRDLRRSWGGDDETALRQLLEAVKATSDNADLLARIRTGD
jgi:transcription termination factor Rho